MRPADRAWLVLGGGVLAWDVTCPRGETLSEGMSRYHRACPWLTRLVVGYVAAHLLDWLPDRFGLLHRATTWR